MVSKGKVEVVLQSCGGGAPLATGVAGGRGAPLAAGVAVGSRSWSWQRELQIVELEGVALMQLST
ncbi:hypothetical protein HanXRQr2_Chr06g0256991 [Helianthus annuus]|uniref:Uncharacterized protein n=1 Tax=Helianthus annuus TaxID=4232 RepID=A0A9K3ISN4_HELAN|nr:hypothetical protein HanXRQr2_Chr16g0726591 [Helianthus annuus]KAF5802218.1 hypothetical protein HanXRQr2_Chr06g0256991 [Helianthus annuus]KAJ0915274.1 hypothetical protein HanPSC8_Chr06g0248001 [Helianthus annuus]